MNIFSPSLFTAPACLPCCTTPSECACALLIPPLASPYADYATAAAAISDWVGDCYAFFDTHGGSFTVNSITADVSVANQVTVTADADNNAVTIWAEISIDSSGTLTITWSGALSSSPTAFENAQATLYECSTGTEVTSDSNFGTSGTMTLTGMAAGEYYLKLSFGGLAAAPLNATASFQVASNVAMITNPVIALWDDSGTTRQLEACPKLYLPPLTESTGDWYTDCASAATVLSGSQVSNCVGYIESLTNVSAFTATDGGTSLTLDETLSAGATSCPVVWGGVNALGGQTLTFTPSAGAGTAGQTATIYDDTGTLVETHTGTGAWTSSALPYSGRYTISVAITSTSNTTSLSVVVTSSGSVSVNSIQARYDLGLTCAATLNCGDTCP